MCRHLKPGKDGAARWRRCLCWMNGYTQALVDAKKREELAKEYAGGFTAQALRGML